MQNIQEIELIYKVLAAAGATRILVVGGYVRDTLLKLSPHDIDTEVYGLEPQKLKDILSQFGRCELAGECFGVFHFWYKGQEWEFSLPRRERKTGAGHTGFEASVDPQMNVREALSRRDYTMNAMAFDWTNGMRLLDPFGGQFDLSEQTLRHVGPAFAEDPLRVLRGMQFCARFGLEAAQETRLMAYSLLNEYAALSKDRVWGEWWKWATQGQWPSMGLQFLYDCNWVLLYPELTALIGCHQDPRWHSEGDAWAHTLEAVDNAAVMADAHKLSQEDRGVLVLAALLHDTGKPFTTVVEDGKITSRGHEAKSAEMAGRFLDGIGAPKKIKEQVVALVREHMFRAVNPGFRAVRRLAVRVAPSNVYLLSLLILADKGDDAYRECMELAHVAEMLQCDTSKPEPILMGRHLLDAMQPGRAMGEVLDAAYEAQLDGVFDSLEGAKAWALEWLKAKALAA
jgi:tRNA nucleotidyltransferase (CCA-adding enzyme)